MFLESFAGTMYIMGKLEVLFFTISNSVIQGGILSPKLFSVYMDDLSKLLINSGICYFIDNVCFNHVFMSTTYLAMSQQTLPCTPPPQNCRGWVNFFCNRCLVFPKIMSSKESLCFSELLRLKDSKRVFSAYSLKPNFNNLNVSR